MSGSGGSNAKYMIEIKKSAEREMDRLPEAIYRRLRDKILALENSPRPAGSQKLQAGEGYRIRVGD